MPGPWFYVGFVASFFQSVALMYGGLKFAGWPGMLAAGFLAILLTIPLARVAAYLDFHRQMTR